MRLPDFKFEVVCLLVEQIRHYITNVTSELLSNNNFLVPVSVR